MDVLSIASIVVLLAISGLIVLSFLVLFKKMENLIKDRSKEIRLNFEDFICFPTDYPIERARFIEHITSTMKLDNNIAVLHKGDAQYQVLPLKYKEYNLYILLKVDPDYDMSVCTSQIILIPPAACNPICDSHLISKIKTGFISFLYSNIRYEIKDGKLITVVRPPSNNIEQYERNYSKVDVRIVQRPAPYYITDIINKAGVSVIVENIEHANVLIKTLQKNSSLNLDFVIVLGDVSIARYIKESLNALSPSTGLILVTNTVIHSI